MGKALWYQQSVDEVCHELDTGVETGLTSLEVSNRLNQYGPNELAHKEGPGIFRMFLEQMKDYMVIILIIASVVSIMVGEVTDSLVIIGIVIIQRMSRRVSGISSR